jgi:hypothetical protein
MKWQARLLNAAPKIQEAYPTYRWIFLTLTVRNPPMAELRETIQHLNNSWQRLKQLKAFPAKGFIKVVEVTRSKRDDRPHPHIHALLLVPARYFTSDYITKSEWLAMWRKSARLDYDPSVEVEAIKPKRGSNLNNLPDLHRGLLEMSKYPFKTTDFLRGNSDAAWLEAVTLQLHKTRAVSIGGVLKDFIEDTEPDNLVNIDENANENAEEEEIKLYFGWRENIQRYMKVDKK